MGFHIKLRNQIMLDMGVYNISITMSNYTIKSNYRSTVQDGEVHELTTHRSHDKCCKYYH